MDEGKHLFHNNGFHTKDGQYIIHLPDNFRVLFVFRNQNNTVEG